MVMRRGCRPGAPAQLPFCHRPEQLTLCLLCFCGAVLCSWLQSSAEWRPLAAVCRSKAGGTWVCAAEADGAGDTGGGA